MRGNGHEQPVTGSCKHRMHQSKGGTWRVVDSIIKYGEEKSLSGCRQSKPFRKRLREEINANTSKLIHVSEQLRSSTGGHEGLENRQRGS